MDRKSKKPFIKGFLCADLCRVSMVTRAARRVGGKKNFPYSIKVMR